MLGIMLGALLLSFFAGRKKPDRTLDVAAYAGFPISPSSWPERSCLRVGGPEADGGDSPSTWWRWGGDVVWILGLISQERMNGSTESPWCWGDAMSPLNTLDRAQNAKSLGGTRAGPGRARACRCPLVDGWTRPISPIGAAGGGAGFRGPPVRAMRT